MHTTALMLSALVVAGPQQPLPSRSSTTIEIPRSVVIAKDNVLVPARDAGALSEILTAEGRYVQEGQVLARQYDKDVRAQRKARALQLDLAIEQAKSNVEEQAAVVTYKTAIDELNESLDINRQEPGAVAESQVRRQRLQAERARLQAEVAREERKIATLQTYVSEAEVEVADLAIERRKILSPLDGKVVKLTARKGEWLQPGDPLLQVVRMDVLRVEGFIRADQALPDEVERLPVTVIVKSPRGDVPVEGVIAFASPLLAGQKGEYRVVAEVQNLPHPTRPDAWQINPGMSAEMIIDLSASPLPLDEMPGSPLSPPPVDPAAPGGEIPEFQPGPGPGTLPPLQPLPGSLFDPTGA